jgi:hypothetical protein
MAQNRVIELFVLSQLARLASGCLATSDEVQVQIWTSWSILVLVKLALIQCSNEVIGLIFKVPRAT